ncbi:MAG: CRISPR system precrRNA processing endoribonuclease RAMP protein Cas6 [Nitrososphaerota archaeon]|nr:CRISPR system precrRNA processing endoribonuclease RAMP protein Cas6 [Candidatus Calditenuis fumarioli]
MITSFLVKAVSPVPIRFETYTGFSVRGMFYALLRSADEDLARSIHEANTISPYSTSVLETRRQGMLFSGTVAAGEPFSFRVGCLDGKVSDAIGRAIAGRWPPLMRVRNADALLQEVQVSVWRPPQQLRVEENMRIEVRFLTPTYFRSTQHNPSILRRLLPRRFRRSVRPVYRYVILPDPYYLFRGLARLYKRFCDPGIGNRSYAEWLLEGGIALETFSGLRVHKVYDEKGRWSRGFTGKALYAIPRDLFDRKMAELTLRLLELARYSNVGGNRTAGFGVIDYRVLGRGDDEGADRR